MYSGTSLNGLSVQLSPLLQRTNGIHGLQFKLFQWLITLLRTVIPFNGQRSHVVIPTMQNNV